MTHESLRADQSRIELRALIALVSRQQYGPALIPAFVGLGHIREGGQLGLLRAVLAWRDHKHSMHPAGTVDKL